MSYKIIIDSCGELTEKMKEDGHFASAALTLYVDCLLYTSPSPRDRV